eukprot:scaffold152634_cov31-Tisochrysis_lutea.AAC.1
MSLPPPDPPRPSLVNGADQRRTTRATDEILCPIFGGTPPGVAARQAGRLRVEGGIMGVATRCAAHRAALSSSCHGGYRDGTTMLRGSMLPLTRCGALWFFGDSEARWTQNGSEKAHDDRCTTKYRPDTAARARAAQASSTRATRTAITGSKHQRIKESSHIVERRGFEWRGKTLARTRAATTRYGPRPSACHKQAKASWQITCRAWLWPASQHVYVRAMVHIVPPGSLRCLRAEKRGRSPASPQLTSLDHIHAREKVTVATEAALLRRPALFVLAQVRTSADGNDTPLEIELARIATEEAAQQLPARLGVLADSLHFRAKIKDVSAKRAVEGAAVMRCGRHGLGAWTPGSSTDRLEDREDWRPSHLKMKSSEIGWGGNHTKGCEACARCARW